jgi:hypothetical protein
MVARTKKKAAPAAEKAAKPTPKPKAKPKPKPTEAKRAKKGAAPESKGVAALEACHRSMLSAAEAALSMCDRVDVDAEADGPVRALERAGEAAQEALRSFTAEKNAEAARRIVSAQKARRGGARRPSAVAPLESAHAAACFAQLQALIALKDIEKEGGSGGSDGDDRSVTSSSPPPSPETERRAFLARGGHVVMAEGEEAEREAAVTAFVAKHGLKFYESDSTLSGYKYVSKDKGRSTGSKARRSAPWAAVALGVGMKMYFFTKLEAALRVAIHMEEIDLDGEAHWVDRAEAKKKALVAAAAAIFGKLKSGEPAKGWA